MSKHLQPLLLIALLFSCTTLFAQHDHCFFDEYLRQHDAENPGYLKEVRQMQADIWDAVQNGNGQNNGRAVRTISVVVHVVYNTTAENVSQTAVDNMIATLNEDYRKLNANFSIVRSAFVPVADDVEIEFCLEQTIRKQTSKTCFNPSTEANDMKFNSTGGSNTVSPSSYLNIWIVDICGNTGGGVAGYALLPTTGVHGSSVDGLVLDYSLGFNNGNGSTATHEIGHYFGLSHPWGNQGGCSDDDGFSDTPNTSGPNYVCSANNSCGTPAPGDMVENFMDYSSCAAMFTMQQGNFMNQVLTQIRGSLLQGNGCNNSTPSAPDADFAGAPLTINVGGTVNFTDLSINNPTSWSWSFPGAATTSSSVQNPSGIQYNSVGTYTVSLTATNSTGSDTETKNAYITVVNAGQSICDTLSNISDPNNITVYSAGAGAGYVSGHNVYGDRAKADFFTGSAGNEVTGMFLAFGLAKAASGSSKVTAKVWDANGPGGAPGTQLASQDVLIQTIVSDLANQRLTTVNFANPATINGDFYAGIELIYGPGDTVALITTTNGENSPATAWEQFNNGTWYRYDNASSWPLDVAHAIFPFICTPSAGGNAPVADFVGSPLTIPVGSTVNFTDQSTNSPTSWSWSFPGAATTSSTTQNPTGIQYNAVGTYDVTLTATNATGSDSETKTDYITVISQGGQGSCDTITNLTNLDSIAVYTSAPGSYVSGHNAFGDLAKADFYTGTAGDEVTGMFLGFGLAKAASGSSKVMVKVWDANGAGGSPGTELASQDLLIQTIVTNLANQQLTVVNFSTPATLNGNFYAGIELIYGPGDTVALLTTTDGQVTPASAWEKFSNGNWFRYDNASSWGLDVAHVIFPFVCSPGNNTNPPVANFSGSSTAVCVGETVTFTDLSTNGPTSWNWTFPGGSPSSSTAANPTVTYSSAGTYNVVLTTTNVGGSDTETKTGYITVTTAPVVTPSVTDLSCFGDNNGTINLSVSGGSGFTYKWNDGNTNQNRTGLAAGQHTVTVTNSQGCETIERITISQPQELTLVVSGANATCGANDGSATSSVFGGTLPYTYSWSTGASTVDLTGLSTGTYTLTLTDANNCQQVGNVTISSTSQATVNLSVTDVSCQGTTDGSITSSVSGGASPFTYSWSNGTTNADLTNVGPGTYSVTVEDNTGCTTVATAIVDTDGPSLNIIKSNLTTCNGSNNGTINVAITGGTTPYTTSWSNGQSGTSLTGLAPGSYTVTVTDNGGCTTIQTVDIETPESPTVNVTTTPATANTADGTATITVTGGNPPYSYLWSTGQTGTNVSGLAAGTYSVTVIDNLGCETVESYTIGVIGGITDVESLLTFDIYPNPNNGNFYINLKFAEPTNFNFELYSTLGKMVYQSKGERVKEETLYLGLNELPAGTYFVKLNTEDGAYVKRVMKTR